MFSESNNALIISKWIARSFYLKSKMGIVDHPKNEFWAK